MPRRLIITILKKSNIHLTVCARYCLLLTHRMFLRLKLVNLYESDFFGSLFQNFTGCTAGVMSKWDRGWVSSNELKKMLITIANSRKYIYFQFKVKSNYGVKPGTYILMNCSQVKLIRKYLLELEKYKYEFVKSHE